MSFIDTRRTYLVFLFSLALVLKLTPLVHSGPFAFGHDYGFYRRFLIQPITSFPNTPVPGLDHTIFIPRLILDSARAVIPSPDVALIATYVCFSLIGMIALWYFVRQYLSFRQSIFSLLLFTLSGIQFLAYKNFFFKEVVALPLFLFALYSLEKKRYAWAALSGIAIVLTQQTTSILFLLVAGAGLLIRALKTRTLSIQSVLMYTGVVGTYLLLHPHVAQKIARPPVGVFVTQTEYLLWSVPLILCALVGLRAAIRTLKQHDILTAALMVPLAFALFHLPFYNRIYIFLDMFLIIPAAFGIEHMIARFSARMPQYRLPIVCLLILIVSIPCMYLLRTEPPLIDTTTRAALVTLTALPVGSAVITSPALLPWVQGWSLVHVYAPGNLKEPHTAQEWGQYWSHQDTSFEYTFLASFPQPLYIFAGPDETMYLPTCATPIRPLLYTTTSCL